MIKTYMKVWYGSPYNNRDIDGSILRSYWRERRKIRRSHRKSYGPYIYRRYDSHDVDMD